MGLAVEVLVGLDLVDDVAATIVGCVASSCLRVDEMGLAVEVLVGLDPVKMVDDGCCNYS